MSVEIIELPLNCKLSTSNCCNPAREFVVEPFVKVDVPSVIVFVETAPDVTSKLAVAKEAIPLLVVVASSPAIVNTLFVTVVSIPSPPVNVNVSVK